MAAVCNIETDILLMDGFRSVKGKEMQDWDFGYFWQDLKQEIEVIMEKRLNKMMGFIEEYFTELNEEMPEETETELKMEDTNQEIKVDFELSQKSGRAQKIKSFKPQRRSKKGKSGLGLKGKKRVFKQRKDWKKFNFSVMGLLLKKNWKSFELNLYRSKCGRYEMRVYRVNRRNAGCGLLLNKLVYFDTKD